MKKSNYDVQRNMISAFCDLYAIPNGLIKIYYLLATELLGTMQIPENSLIFEELKKCIDMLKRNERTFLKHKYGLYDGVPKTLHYIANENGITTERVRQVVNRAFLNLSYKKSVFYIPHKLQVLETRKKEIEREIAYYTKIIGGKNTAEITIDDLGFSTRAYNCLKSNGYIHYEQLMKLSSDDIVEMKNCGIKTAKEIWFKLHGVSLPDWY